MIHVLFNRKIDCFGHLPHLSSRHLCKLLILVNFKSSIFESIFIRFMQLLGTPVHSQQLYLNGDDFTNDDASDINLDITIAAVEKFVAFLLPIKCLNSECAQEKKKENKAYDYSGPLLGSLGTYYSLIQKFGLKKFAICRQIIY